MMAGLQGAGKTTTTAKLAGKYKLKGKKPLLVACDVYRPAAVDQLKINGEKQGVEVFALGDKIKPVDIAKASVEHAKNTKKNIVIIDTAGRLHIDEDMMQELTQIKVFATNFRQQARAMLEERAKALQSQVDDGCDYDYDPAEGGAKVGAAQRDELPL